MTHLQMNITSLRCHYVLNKLSLVSIKEKRQKKAPLPDKYSSNVCYSGWKSFEFEFVFHCQKHL
jgi:hypothetical protein